jgi:hypothetical protein
MTHIHTYMHTYIHTYTHTYIWTSLSRHFLHVVLITNHQVVITVCTGVETLQRLKKKIKLDSLAHQTPPSMVTLLNRCVERGQKPTAKDIMMTMIQVVDCFTDRSQLMKEYKVI